MRPRPTHVALRRLALLAFCGAALLGAADARPEKECDIWFPDLSCERLARPAGSVMPMSFPFLFEDPYITTGTNAIGIWQRFPRGSLLGSGGLGVLAIQARIALRERLAFIVTKDGYGWLDSDQPLLRDDSGFFNVTAGFKYAVWRWETEDEGAILTPSLRYEIPLGQSAVFQDQSGDALIPALSAAYHNGGWHVVGGFGGQLGLDDANSSSSLFYNLHVDHAFPLAARLRFIVPFAAVNGLHYVRSGDGGRTLDTRAGRLSLAQTRALLGVSPFEGGDLANLGADGIAGAEWVTLAGGLRFVLGEGLYLGAAYELPVSRRKDLLDQRLTLMIGWEL